MGACKSLVYMHEEVRAADNGPLQKAPNCVEFWVFFPQPSSLFLQSVFIHTHKVSKVKIQVHPESHMGSQAEGDSTGVGAGRDC